MPVMTTGKYLIGLHPHYPMLIMRLLLVQNKLYHKLLTAKIVLAVNLKHLKNELEWAEGNDLDDLATEFQEIIKSFVEYKTRVNDNMCDLEIKAQLLSDVDDLFNPCLQLHDGTMSDALRDPFKGCPPETDLDPEDSVSQVASCQGAMSATSNELLARQIDLDRRRAELRAIHARGLARAKKDAAAAEAEARLQIGEAKLEAEEKYIALSESGLSVAVLERFKNKFC